MRDDQLAKALQLKALHESGVTFAIGNAWDRGSARLLTAAGFPALATSGAGLAFSRGEPNGAPGEEAIFANAADIVAATHLPVSADLENGFGHTPEAAARCIERAIAIGLAGASIEDATYSTGGPIYDLERARAKIQAAAEAVRRSGVPFQLVARAENFLHGRPDLQDTVRRLQAYQDAGADVLYAPGLATAEQIRAVVGAVDRPVNVVMGLVGSDLSLEELSDLGVARVSVGSAFARRAYGALVQAAQEVLECGTFGFAADAIPMADIERAFMVASEPIA
ncbi:isocitrate lyase/phosphoenolpyruvate mutase family protein [Altererythrobacter soli]|uniref:Isocitrate lyase/phosphoenolpyruvate mutase family protein n=1 Tax=Croceibacterium soli TaxID=1739690 RepID=A0A6I4UXT2_9SPHN|nr:isocitrate lyase/phosphoenolpyruvate mutase family protein [Croceibacterium soli]MXP42764.1 isocitrate lyase/phosphoenolpyruvate mutase family protein [Croceibacterium soli]